MELNTVTLSDFTKLADVIWFKGFESVKTAMQESGLVKKVAISEHTGSTREFSEIDTNEYLTYKGESDQAARGKIQQGYKNTMTKYRVAENIGISYEMRTENKYPEIIGELMGAGRKGQQTIELDLTHRLTFGIATSYTDRDGRTIAIDCGDDLQLFYSAHKLKGSSTTFRNRVANNPKVSKGAIEAVERLITEETYNHLGEKKTAVFDIIFSGDDPNTVNTVKEYLKSTGAPEAAHTGVANVYAGKYKHVVLPLLATTNVGAPDSDKRYYWGIASSQMSSMFLGIWETPHLIPPAANENSEDVQTDDWEFRNRAGFGITTVGAGWIKFSSGDGTA